MDKKDDKGKTFTENTSLYTRMTYVCHVLMFLYGAAFWIQIGVFPVSSIELGPYISQLQNTPLFQ